jgi:DNA-3-methyladenine glycosylase
MRRPVGPNVRSTDRDAAAPSPTATLSREFYARQTAAVAEDLLGRVLVHLDHGVRRAGRIVETEAYVGSHDLACHASKGRTARTEVLFGPPGHAYVYLIYGMYHCFNAVTEREGHASAVLVRALAPLEGCLGSTQGPGRLCRALGLTRAQNRMDLTSSEVTIEAGVPVASRAIARGPRIGVDYAGAWAREPLRFWIRDDPHVSRGAAARSTGRRGKDRP